MKIAYESRRFSDASLATIANANRILAEYAGQGFDLTLRQLYYQFVSRDLVANKDTEYKRLGSIINDARLAGLIDWDSIIDRTRNLRGLGHWDSPAQIMRGAVASFANDKWAKQPYRVEVWIEKDALVGVIDGVCNELDVPYFSCRGYTSQSEMWRAARRLGYYIQDGQKVKVIHLGDHDPSGIDMSRDIQERLWKFIANDAYREQWQDVEGWGDVTDSESATRLADDYFSVDRVALTMAQIEQYNPPPNPAKLTDSRGAGYVELYGYESWELDALAPTDMADLIRDGIADVIDQDAWDESLANEERQKRQLRAASDRWSEVVEYLGE